MTEATTAAQPAVGNRLFAGPASLGIDVVSQRIVLRALDPLQLPDLPGVILRGAVGRQFEQLYCVRPDDKCASCRLNTCCNYTRFFEPAAGGGHASAPFVLRARGPRTVAAGQTYPFDLLLFNQAAVALPAWLHALELAGDLGLHYENHRPDVRHGRFVVVSAAESPPPDAPLSAGRVVLHFVTPFETTHQGRVLRRFEPAALAAAAKRRLEALSPAALRADAAWHAWMDAVFDQARRCEVVRDDTAWYESRKSPTAARHRSKAELKSASHPRGHAPLVQHDGLVGGVELAGVGPDLLCLLRLAAEVHLGKDTAVGKGRLILEPLPGLPTPRESAPET